MCWVGVVAAVGDTNDYFLARTVSVVRRCHVYARQHSCERCLHAPWRCSCFVERRFRGSPSIVSRWLVVQARQVIVRDSAARLVHESLERGNTDNLTAVVAWIH